MQTTKTFSVFTDIIELKYLPTKIPEGFQRVELTQLTPDTQNKTNLATCPVANREAIMVPGWFCTPAPVFDV